MTMDHSDPVSPPGRRTRGWLSSLLDAFRESHGSEVEGSPASACLWSEAQQAEPLPLGVRIRAATAFDPFSR